MDFSLYFLLRCLSSPSACPSFLKHFFMKPIRFYGLSTLSSGVSTQRASASEFENLDFIVYSIRQFDNISSAEYWRYV